MNSKWFLTLAMLTLTSIIFWIGFNVYQKMSTPVTSPTTQQIQSVSPKFDTDLINQLESWSKGTWDQ